MSMHESLFWLCQPVALVAFFWTRLSSFESATVSLLTLMHEVVVPPAVGRKLREGPPSSSGLDALLFRHFSHVMTLTAQLSASSDPSCLCVGPYLELGSLFDAQG